MDDPENGVTLTYDGSEALLKTIKAFAGNIVLVGIPSGSGRADNGPDNAALGYVHEFGSPAKNIPPRPFLIPGVNSVRDKAVKLLQRAAELQLDNKPGPAMQALQAVGQVAADAVKAKIVSGPFAPLKPATIAARRRRGNLGTKPLIDTTQLLKSITYVIRKRGSK
jgi:hypothetical protein